MKQIISIFLLTIIYSTSSYSQNYKEYLNLSYQEIDSLVMVPYEKGDVKTCILFMEAGREKARKEFGVQDSTFAEYTSHLSFFYIQIALYNKALPLAIQANNIYKKVLGKEHSKVTTALSNLTELHKKAGNYELALPCAIQAINIYKKIKGSDDTPFASLLNNLALVHSKMGNFDLALPLAIQANDIYKNHENTLAVEHLNLATSLSNLATLHINMGNYDLALPFTIQANDIYKKMHKETPEYANSLNNLSFLYSNMGNYDLALPLAIQTSHILKKILGQEHHIFASSLYSLASLYRKMKKYRSALPLAIQANEILEKTLGTKHPNSIKSLQNLASIYSKMGNYNSTWETLTQAMNNSSSIQLKHTFDKTWLDSLKKAPYHSNQHIEQMVHSLNTVYLLLKKDNSVSSVLSKQAIVTDLATFLLNKARNQVANKKDKLRILSQSNTWLLRNLNVLDDQQDMQQAFLRADQNKSVLLLEATKSEAAYSLGDLPDSLVLLDKKTLRKQSYLQAKLSEKRSDNEKNSLRKKLNQVNQDRVDFVKMIKATYPKYHQLKYHQVDFKIEAIQKNLDHQTALLEYVIGDSVIHIFCVDKKQVLWKKSFIKNKKLALRIKKFHYVLRNYDALEKNKKLTYQAYTEQAYWFYQNLVAPVLKERSPIKNLIIVTDGELGHLPFEAFLKERAPQNLTDYNQLHYLVTDYNISYNYSATLWKDNVEARTPENNGQILGLAANYNLQLDSSMRKIRLPADQLLRTELPTLPDARKEVETLQENYQGFFLFDILASEKTVKENASDFAILHFATHGVLDARRPILSSLAFTEDNDPIESNFWQAHEISKIKLNANLVVLSGCETGYGKFEKGNGVASLARAFMYAGASSLIVSLWQVNDYATSKIMKNIYENLANGMKKDEALRQAKLQYMTSAKGIFAHPAFWSPFIQMGNTDPVSIKRKSGMVPWSIGGGLFLLVLIRFTWSRREKEMV